MKIEIQMKTPDVVEMAVMDALEFESPSEDELGEFDGDEDEWRRAKSEELCEFAEKWFQYGETVTIELDTEAETARVVPR